MASFKNINLLKKTTTVLFATFSVWIGGKRLPTNGNIEPLRDFLVPKVKKLVIIDQATPGSDLVMPKIEVYERNKKNKVERSSWWLYILWPFLKLFNQHGTRVVFKLRDFFSVLDWCFKDRTSYDFFIGLESINALAGIFLRKLGFIKRVVYYVSDYSPQRYKIKWFNWVYVWLDRLCAIHADYIWDVSKAMQPARIQAGLNPKKSALEIHVPNGLYPEQIKFNHLSKVKPYTLVYMGTLGPENGPDLVIEALPQVLTKFSQTKLYIIGGSNADIKRLEEQAKRIGVLAKIKCYGFVSRAQDMSRIIRSCYLALAPYRTILGSPRYYADAGKIRAYCAAGLPVVTTEVPPLGREAAEKGAAIVVKDNSNELTSAITKLFSNRQLYLQLRSRAIQFAKDSTWEHTFSSAFSQIEKGKQKYEADVVSAPI